MEEKYIQFLNYRWNECEEWRKYFNNLSEIPKTRELVMKFRKRFYKYKVDDEFDDKYDPNDKYEKVQERKPKEKRIGIVELFIASIEAFLWVSFYFNLMFKEHVLKISILAILVRILRMDYKMFFQLPKLDKNSLFEYCNKFLLNKHIQLLMYIIILNSDNINFLVLFPISTSAVFYISTYFSKYMRILEFLKKYFEKVIKAKKDFESLIGFSYVLIGIYFILSVLLRYNTPFYLVLFWVFIYILYKVDEDISNTFRKLKNTLGLIVNNKYIPLRIKSALNKFLGFDI